MSQRLDDDTGRYVRTEHGYIEYRYAPGLTVEIVNIEVEGEFRRLGYGRKLMELLFKEVSKTGKCARVYAITRSENMIAQEFYERLGFRVCGNLREFYNGTHDIDAVLYNRSPEGPV